MGKDSGPMTAKAIGKKIKAKGLQKLKFYCQMCQKQCRDANGFKCHMTSEAHQRQLLLFADNPNKYLGSYSDEFLKGFLYLMKTRFSRRVAINCIYQEYIKDRDHVHLNATRWITLTGLAKWMGRKGIAHVEETEKGWFVTYIDREHETLEKEKSRHKKEKLDRDYEERMAQIIEHQIERGKAAAKNPETSDQPSTSSSGELSQCEKIAFTLKPIVLPQVTDSSSKHTAQHAEKSIASVAPDVLTGSSSKKSGSSVCSSSYSKRNSDKDRKRTALQQLREEEEEMKAKKCKRDYWLTPGIVVKVIAQKLGDKYYKKKAEVRQVIDRYEAVVQMLDSKDQLKLDQAHVETVIPNVGRTVRVVNGPYVGSDAKLLVVNFETFSCKIMLDSGPFTGRVIDNVQYDEICKRA